MVLTGQFQPGQVVCITGLEKRPELNGSRGIVVRYVADRERWEVKLDAAAQKETLGLRLENLRPIPRCCQCEEDIVPGEPSAEQACGHRLHLSCAQLLCRFGATSLCCLCRPKLSATPDLKAPVEAIVDEAATLLVQSSKLFRLSGEKEAQRVASLASALGKQTVASNPKSSKAHIVLASALAKLGDSDGELAESRAAAGCAPKDGLAQATLAMALLQRGHSDEGLSLCLRAVKEAEEEDAHLYFAYGSALQQQLLSSGGSDWSLVEKAYQLAANCDPYHIEAKLALAQAHRSSGSDEQATDLLKEVLKLDPRNLEAYCSLAMAQRAKGDQEGELASLLAAVKVGPRDARAHRMLALCLGRRGDFEKAISILNNISNIHPEDVEIKMFLAAMHKEKGELEKAYELYHSLSMSHPDHPVNSIVQRESQELLRQMSPTLAS
mmetsp:Transcript_71513/g.149537  ORF Transcript_71513/g.149537 Transcript_71513/m.149537 type:complete len:439 (-) Transcript_71513:12-1328(-)